jgi:hypothetical protein
METPNPVPGREAPIDRLALPNVMPAFLPPTRTLPLFLPTFSLTPGAILKVLRKRIAKTSPVLAVTEEIRVYVPNGSYKKETDKEVGKSAESVLIRLGAKEAAS